VADKLEANWNTRLRELTEARQEYEKRCCLGPQEPGDNELLEIQRIADDFPKVWQNKELPDRERKRILRLIIEDVTLHEDEQITAHIRFKGGATKTVTVPLLPRYLELL